MKEVGRWSCSLSVPTALRCWARRSQCITSHFEETRVRTLALRDRLSTPWVIGNEWTEDVERLISMYIIQITSFGRFLSFILCAFHHTCRLNWCNELKARMIPSLVFSNKPRFCLWVHDNWRRPQRMEKYRFFWVQYATPIVLPYLEAFFSIIMHSLCDMATNKVLERG
jgi:hypothetical protein